VRGRAQRSSTTSAPATPVEDDRADLLRAFGIEAGDLEANRAGGLGPRQQEQLRKSGLRNMAGAVAGVAVLAAILLLVADRPFKPVQFGVAGALGLVLLAVGAYDLRRTSAAASAGRVEVLTGPIHVISRGSSGWFLVVADEQFRMPVRPWHLRAGEAYHVYIAPGTRRVVAMEPQGEAGNR